MDRNHLRKLAATGESRRLIAESRTIVARAIQEVAEMHHLITVTESVIFESCALLERGRGYWPIRMDRVLIAEHLQKARNHVAESEAHVRRQRTIVADLERDGHDTALARELLAKFERMLVLHVADRDRLVEELSEEHSWSDAP
jgi:hypothetical protein